MKLNLKIIAAAAAMVAASGAHADFTPNLTNSTTGNSSLVLVAFNAVTNSYYYRDLGYNLNSFLPNAVTTTSGDGGGSPITGDKTSEAGFSQTWGAGSFASWLTGQANQADVRWTIAAGDGASTVGTTNLSRALVSFAVGSSSTASNNSVRGAANTLSGVSGLIGQNGATLGYDAIGIGGANGLTVPLSFLSNNSFGASTLSLLGGVANLFYYTTTTGGGSLGSTLAPSTGFSNSLNTATLSLASTGELTYNLDAAGPPAAVPVPAAAWLLGSGLLAFGGMVRRRKASAAAA